MIYKVQYPKGSKANARRSLALELVENIGEATRLYFEHKYKKGNK